MKPLALILALSIAANAALALLLVRSTGIRPDKSAGSASVALAADKTATAKASAGTTALADVDAKTWKNLQAGDLKGLVERLRAAGFPPAVIRAIVEAQLDEKYSVQRKALLANQGDSPYWQRGIFAYDAKLMAAVRDLSKQEREELKTLVGPDDAAHNDERAAWQRRQYGDLPAEKIEQMQSIISDYSDLRNEVYSKANGIMLSEDREKLALLETEQRSDLAAMLTPEELENYELRSSTTANMIRSQLTIFKPTETEFRAMFEATRAAEAQYGTLTNGPTNSDQAEKIRSSVLASLQSQMSPDRYAELNQATDPKYQMTNRLVARLDLPASAAVDTVAIQQDIQQKAMALRRDTTLTPEQRTSQLADLSQEATNKLTATLTPRGLEAYKQYGGYWLQNLNPPVRRTTGTP